MTTVHIPAAGVDLEADLKFADGARGVVLFIHGNGSSRHGPRNRMVAGLLNAHGHCTVVVDLLTPGEKRFALTVAGLRFDLGPLAGRTVDVVDWLATEKSVAGLPIGLFGSGSGAAAALFAAAARPQTVRALVCRSGRPDLAGPILSLVRAPTLLLVSDRDRLVVNLNQRAALAMKGVRRLQLVRNAGHMFEEPGALAAAARLTAAWFDRYLAGSPSGDEPAHLAGRPRGRYGIRPGTPKGG